VLGEEILTEPWAVVAVAIPATDFQSLKPENPKHVINVISGRIILRLRSTMSLNMGLYTMPKDLHGIG
jgi:hypothetical protein